MRVAPVAAAATAATLVLSESEVAVKVGAHSLEA